MNALAIFSTSHGCSRDKICFAFGLDKGLQPEHCRQRRLIFAVHHNVPMARCVAVLTSKAEVLLAQAEAAAVTMARDKAQASVLLAI